MQGKEEERCAATEPDFVKFQYSFRYTITHERGRGEKRGVLVFHLGLYESAAVGLD